MVDALSALMRDAMRCTLCNAPALPGCKCWVRLACPGCGRSIQTERAGLENELDEHDIAWATCPDCDAKKTKHAREKTR